MRRALVVTHTESEGPGLLARWLPAAGLELDVVRAWAGDPLPARMTEHVALVVMGGPQQAYDDRSAPWLRPVKGLLRAAVADGVPVLGICLGAQLLAEATGGRVAPGEDGPELGARLVAKRDTSASDALFAALPFTPTVVQWHWDVIVELPPGAVLLASSTRYANQAFRVGDRAWGLQFHIETPPDMLTSWAEADDRAVRDAGLDPVALLASTLAELDEVAACWRPVLERFAALALG